MNINFNYNQKILWDNEWYNNPDCHKKVEKTNNPELDEETIAKINNIMFCCAHRDINIEAAISELTKCGAIAFDKLKTEAGQDVIKFNFNGKEYTIIINKSPTPTEFEKIKEEWRGVASAYEIKINNAKSFREFIELNQELVDEYFKYIGKMAACDDLSLDDATWIQEAYDYNIENAKKYCDLMKECEMMEERTIDFIEEAYKKYPGWEDLENNSIIKDPGKYMLDYYKIYKQNPNPNKSLSGAYSGWLRIQFELLDIQYDVLVQQGKINPEEDVKHKDPEEKINTDKKSHTQKTLNKQNTTHMQSRKNNSAIF